LIFFVGIGADEKLASTWQTLIIGRLVYYLGIPLLIGLLFDAPHLPQEPPTGGVGVPLPTVSLKNFSNLLNVIGPILTIVAPSLYAYFVGQPLLINYFDLLDTILKLTL
jgi:hypothetical protein